MGQCGATGGAGGDGGDCTIIVNNITRVHQVSNVSWSMPAPIAASAPVYSDGPTVQVQMVQAPPIVTCALPFGTLYGNKALRVRHSARPRSNSRATMGAR